MCYNGFAIKINYFKSKRLKDGRCTYKNPGSSNLICLFRKIFSHFNLIYEKLQKICVRSFLNLLQYVIFINDVFFC